MQSTSPPTVIRLRADAFAAWAAREGLGSETAQAKRIGVAQTNLNRILRGVTAPGEQFIAAVLTVTGTPFEYLFEITEAS
jgi:transcriptional regulator with XRE-family HTH domain